MATCSTRRSNGGWVTTSRVVYGRISKGYACMPGFTAWCTGNYHRLLSRVFPFGIFYTIEDATAVVWAVVDLRRDPTWIRQRLNE